MKDTLKAGLSLKMRIFLSIAFLSVIVLLIMSSLYSVIHRKRVLSSWQDIFLREHQLVSNHVNSMLTYLSDCAISVATNEVVIELTRKNTSIPSDAAYSIMSAIGTVVDNTFFTTPQIYKWLWVTRSGEYLGSSDVEDAYMSEELIDTIYKSAHATRKASFHGPFWATTEKKETFPFYCIAKPIIDLHTLEYYGMIAFVIPDSIIINVVEANVSDELAISYCLCTESDQIIYPVERALAAEKLDDFLQISNINKQNLQKQGYIMHTVNDEQVMYVYQNAINARFQWQVLSAISINDVLSIGDHEGKVIFGIALGACVITLLIAHVISHSISKPILRFINSIKDLKNNRMLLAKEGSNIPEVQMLYQEYNRLVYRINSLLDHIEQEQTQKRKLQFKILQAQIKPHFLYNSLNMIKSLIELKMYDLAEQAIMALSLFYRLSLNNGEDVTLLRNELQLSEQFMFIQKLRYQDILNYQFDIPAQLLDHPVPHMLFQPLLENAIEHGIKGNQGIGHITVSACEHEGGLVFYIKDDGKGIPQEKLEYIRKILAEPTLCFDNSVFALRNVQKRIKLLCSAEAELTIDSRYGEGTTITIFLPVRE